MILGVKPKKKQKINIVEVRQIIYSTIIVLNVVRDKVFKWRMIKRRASLKNSRIL